MKKEILEQAVLDYISEKFMDKVVDKRVQTFFTYSELVDTVLSFAELLNKNIEELEQENAELRSGCGMCYSKDKDMLIKAKELLKRCYENYIYLEPLRSEIKQFLEEK